MVRRYVRAQRYAEHLQLAWMDQDYADDHLGPYATAILRFYISFPDTYPALPPLVTFSTDMFHPLITPLTTYMYTTDIQEGGTVSATDEERLPPGGFSLRHGFPDWFGRGSRGRPAPGQYPPETPRSSRALAAGGDSNSSTPNSKIAATPPSAGGGHAGNAGTGGSTGSKQSFMDVHKRDISTGEVLSYIRSTFDDQAVMDSIPLEAAGNPGAWHAWAAYRGHTTAPEGEPAVRKPGEWNWEGVWEERVQRNIQASLSEPVLYGDVGSDDTVRYLHPKIVSIISLTDTSIDSIPQYGRRRSRDGEGQPLQDFRRISQG